MTITASTPNLNVQVSYFSLDLILTLTFKMLTLHQSQVPVPTTARTTGIDTSSLVPDAFYGVGMLIWVRWIGVLYVFVF
jgi:hypothetical protein